MSPKELALKAITDVFIRRDITAFDKYFSEGYEQHNPFIPNGVEALKELLPMLPENFKYEPGIVMADGNLVMIHGRYENWNGKNMIAVDIFRIENDKLAAHWDIMQEEVLPSQSANGNGMFPIK